MNSKQAGINYPILLADDDDDYALLLRFAFDHENVPISLHHVSTGSEALAYLEGRDQFSDRTKHPFPRLALVDVKMPGKTGFEVLEWVRTKSEFKTLPVVLLSGIDMGKDKQRALELGATMFLVKHILVEDKKRFLVTIMDLVKNPSATDKTGLSVAA